MKSLFAKIFGGMTIIAIIYCNYRAVKDSTPFLRRQRDRITNSKPYSKVSGWVNRVTQSNIVQGTKSKVNNASGRVVHMFKRSETA